MRVFRFLLPAALAAFLVLLVPCRAGLPACGSAALAETGLAPTDAPEDEKAAERLVVSAVRLVLLPVEALSRALTACEEKQGEEAPGWVREGAGLLRAWVEEMREFLPSEPEDSGGSHPESDVSLTWPSPVCKLRLV